MRKSKEEHIAEAKRHIENARETLRLYGKKRRWFLYRQKICSHRRTSSIQRRFDCLR
jgi:hypothetical protein